MINLRNIFTSLTVAVGSTLCAVHECTSYTDLQNNIKEGLAIVDVYATWCHPCQRMAPNFAEVSQRYPTVKFLKIEYSNANGLASSFPTLILYQDGKEVRREIGYQSSGGLENLLKSAFGSKMSTQSK